MKDNINIEKLFSDKLSNHESIVSDKVWSGIQSQIGVGVSSATVVAKGVSMTSKWIIGISSVVAISAVAVVLNFSESKNEINSPEKNSTDSTEISAKNKEVILENSVKEVIKETSSKSGIFNSTPTSNSKNKIAQEIKQIESVSNVSSENVPEKLIVKQAIDVREVAPETPTQIKTEKINKEIKEVSKPISETSIASNASKGLIQEWKKTNVFSPNNDGVNDLFFLETKELKEFSITVINEKNDVVFISDDSKFKWDGTDYKTGEMVPEGSYGYIVFAVDIYNSPIKIFNTLKISR